MTSPLPFHSWAPFWELNGAALLGWGGGLWPGNGAPGQRPRPLASSAELSGLWRWPPRPGPGPAKRSCEGFGVPEPNAISHFLPLLWLQGPRLSLTARSGALLPSLHCRGQYGVQPGPRAPTRRPQTRSPRPVGLPELGASLRPCLPSAAPNSGHHPLFSFLHVPPVLAPRPRGDPNNARPRLDTPSCPPPPSPLHSSCRGSGLSTRPTSAPCRLLV